MKNNLRSKLSRKWMSHAFVGRIAVLFFAAGLSACNHAESKDPGESQAGVREFAVTFDAKGNVVIKNRDGKQIGEPCSADPKAPNVCPIFKPGHKVQVEQAVYLQGIRYHGSPECLVLMINGDWYVLPDAAFCGF